MYRSLALFLTCVSVFFAANHLSNPSKAQTSKAADPDLAAAVKRLADRSTFGLFEASLPDGGVELSFDGRFQNVPLVLIGGNGEPKVGCISTPAEADAFFGRELETGRPLAAATPPDADLGRSHGMSDEEMAFYREMIDRAVANRLDNPANAAIVIQNLDGAGEGFNDTTARAPEGGNTGTTLGQQRMNLFEFAAAIWGAYLDSSVTTVVGSKFDPLTPCASTGAVLGQAGSNNVYRDFPGAPQSGTWYSSSLANKVSGIDNNGASVEINATFNSGIDTGCLGPGTRFYYGLNGATPSGTVNLLTVLLHEIGHGLGFQSYANGTTGALLNGFPDVFTKKMYDRSTGQLWTQMTDPQRQASALNNGNLLFDGSNVRVASAFLTAGRESSTGRVQLFAPNPLQSGSSLSHFDSAASPNLLMEPMINPGLPLDLDLTRQEMRDIGWYRDTNGDRVADTITNVMPGAGGTVPMGAPFTISWTNGGGFSRNVIIELSLDGGATYPTVVASNVPNTGTYVYTSSVASDRARVRVREYNFVDPSGASSGDFRILHDVNPPTQTPTPTPSPTASPTPAGFKAVPFDFDGDRRADVSIYRPSNGIWYVDRSRDGGTALQLGNSTDRIAPADYDGDGRVDMAVYRPSLGLWYRFNSSNSTYTTAPFGIAGDIPVPADYDGDNVADVAIYRPATGTWWVQRSGAGLIVTQFGASGDIPAAADYDGDGRADFVVYRPSNGVWYMRRSSAGDYAIQFGNASDKVVPADYDGDGKTDVAIFRPSQSTWYIVNSSNGQYPVQVFGLATDIPSPADYDGDGRSDVAIFRPSSGQWWLNRTQSGLTVVQFGLAGDRAVPNAFSN